VVDLAEYITEKGGLNECAKALREYKAKMKPAAEPNQNDDEPEETTVESVRIDVLTKPTLCLIDAEGFVEKVPAALAATLIAQMLARR
jgi:hypothetical protein